MNSVARFVKIFRNSCGIHNRSVFSVCRNNLSQYQGRIKYKENVIIAPLATASLALSSFARNKLKPTTEADVEDNILHLMTLARIALEKGDTDRAEGILQMGLKISEEHKVYLGMPYMYDILSAIAFAKGNLGKAEQLLVNVIEKLLQVGVPESSNHIVDFKLRLARIYSSYKESNLAEIGFRTCLNEQKSKLASGDFSSKTGVLYINILFWYALHKIRMEEYNEAKKMLNAAYEYAYKIEGLSPYQEMVLLYTLADLNMTLEDNIVALEIMQNTILMAKGIGSPDLPKCYVKLAKIYKRMNSPENAKISAVEAAKLAKMFSDQEVYLEANKLIEEINKA
ncbi:tetratricopeptide repeat protein 19, mitochondrial-like [Coccinella septempunctata]|uniref:tetratricopeptide repeat protein 19, mitochondrial-like n=1 Tax=Coccinella septempunctata TaxID=41139 RepID=UPI001D070C89|nr:tetratricopeptide repeat protein 19, mitochondrial-like [Coccinella septempunctata]